MEIFARKTQVTVQEDRFESFSAEILKEEPWGLGEPVYLVRITAGAEMGCITHARHSWITPVEEDKA